MQRTSRSGMWNFLAVSVLVGSAWYAWPIVLATIKDAVKETLKEKRSPW